jgi:hypothetical protein
MKKLCLLLCFILIGCGAITPIAPPTPASSSISFQPLSITKKDVAEKEGLDLVVGIFGASKDVVYLYGGMLAYDGEPRPMQSTLLRSNDGGAHWKEAMIPVSNSYIKLFAMLESGAGWALIYEPLAQNQPYQYILYKTIDYGESWKEASIIPLSSAQFPLALQMIFVDQLHGQIDMLYEDSFGYLEFLTTNDGGENWKPSGAYQPKFDGNTSTMAILDSYHSLVKDDSKSFSLDRSSYWNLNGEYGNPDVHVIVIQRQIYSDDGSVNAQEIMLPKHFNYVDGQIIAP